MIVKAIATAPIGTNCYLLGDESAKVCAVVDPGGSVPEVLEMISGTGCTLSAIFLTHGHYDHTGGVAGLEAAYPGTPVYIHRADMETGVPAIFPPLPQEVLRYYSQGDQVAVGALTVQVLHTPGHSQGSVVLRAGEVLFTGDTLFRGSCGRTDLPGGSYDEIMSSLRRLAALEGDFQVCPGHEGLSTLEQERRGNYYMRAALGVE